jgi:hypothetical protein
MSWLGFWTIFLAASLVGFAVLVVVITVLGFRELQLLVAHHRPTREDS